jgi:hypothetical protein
MHLLAALLLLLDFGAPQRVTIRGYEGGAMEPFLTRDGRYLLFNNTNVDEVNTDLHIAERVDDLTFNYLGKLEGANSPELDGVASADAAGNLYFISVRSYFQTLSTVYRGRLEGTTLKDVTLVPNLTRGVLGQIIFDAEITRDGSTLYFVDGLFKDGPVPAAADLAVAVRGTDGILRRVDDDRFAAVNTSALEFAPATSDDGLELFFTRIVNGEPAIFRSTRRRTTDRWEAPSRVTAITGYTEAPALAPGGNALYYHARRDGHFVIERVTRPASRRRAVRR